MNDVDRVGGVPVVMKALLDAGLMHGDCLTVTGKTMAENLADIAPPDVDGTIVRALEQPDPPDRRHHHPARLAGSRGCGGQERRLRHRRLEGHRPGLRRRAGRDGRAGGRHGGRRRRRGHPLRGPQGRPGHARDAGHHRRDQGRRAGQGRHADHRRPLLRRHHRPLRRATSPRRRPRAARSPWSRTATRSPSTWPTASSTWRSTRPSWTAAARSGRPTPRPVRRGVLAKYAKLVQSANVGAVCS